MDTLIIETLVVTNFRYNQLYLAIAFSKLWKGFSGLEKQRDLQFVTELLARFGLNANEVGSFQEKAETKWVDYLWPGTLGIEMKSPNENLKKAKDQLFNYLSGLPPEARPKIELDCSPRWCGHDWLRLATAGYDWPRLAGLADLKISS
jgi:hypothetical protein